MRNWMVLRPASFRGVGFQVDEEAIPKSGRRVVRHEYVKAEEHGTEDMGRLPREFKLKAYIANDRADTEAQALIDACSTAGAATLVLPFFRPQQVRCEGCSGSWRKTKLGYVEIELEFVEAGSDGAGFPAIPLGDRIAAGALDGLAGLVEDALSAFDGGGGFALDASASFQP